jgi:hypothetical protein
MSLFSFKNKPTLSLVFDIRDTFISVAATRFEENKKPEIVYIQRFSLDVQDVKDTKKYFNNLTKTIDRSILFVRKSLSKIGNKDIIKKYHFFLSSPWSISQSKLIKFIKDKKFTIDNSLLQKIILGESDKIEKDIEYIKSGADWFLFEEKIIRSKLNGYQVERIYQRKAQDVEIDIFVSFLPQDLLLKLKTVIDVKKTKIEINSSILSSFTFLRDLYDDKNNFIYIDISSNITDVYVVRDDVVFGIISFPFGEKNIIQNISKKFKISEDIIYSLFTMKCHGKSDKTTKDKVEDYIEYGLQEWIENFDSTIVQICSESNIPKNIFVVSDSDFDKIVYNKIKKDFNINIFKKNGMSLKVDLIEESVVDSCLMNSNFFKNEPYVKMDVVFLNKILNKK